MPCRDYYDDHPSEYFRNVAEPELKRQISFAESALCAALVALEHVDSLVETVAPKQGDFYDWLNFKKAGITKAELLKWHSDHKKRDAHYREQERLKTLKESALAKLTDEERKVLGVK
jgi:hypothetical protein